MVTEVCIDVVFLSYILWYVDRTVFFLSIPFNLLIFPCSYLKTAFSLESVIHLQLKTKISFPPPHISSNKN